MKKLHLAIGSVLIIAALAACGSSPRDGGGRGPVAGGAVAAAAAGESARIAVLMPEANGLDEGCHLPALVQKRLRDDFLRFSDFYVLCRITLLDVLLELESVIYQTTEDIGRLGEVENVDFVLRGSLTRTADAHVLDLTVAGTGRGGRGNLGIPAASFLANFTAAEIENLSGVRRASAALLTDMGVQLSDAAQREITEAFSQQAISAQTEIARGITAERTGNILDAVTHYFQAATFDPHLLGSGNRISLTQAAAPGRGLTTAQARVQAQNEWRGIANAARAFYSTHVPYKFVYRTDFTYNVNAARRTVDITIGINLIRSDAWITIQEIQAALRAASDNALRRFNDRWNIPFNNLDIGPRQITVVMEVVNDRGQVISSADHLFARTVQGQGGEWLQANLRFTNIHADNITDQLTFRVASINGIPAQRAAETGFMQISNFQEFYNVGRWSFNGNTIVGVRYLPRTLPHPFPQPNRIEIPSSINGVRVTGIGARAFHNRNIVAVTIPEGVTSIGDNAFSSNQLTSVTIPSSVTFIGNAAFRDNQLSSVTLGNSVTRIGDHAFRDNRLTSVTIPGSTAVIGYAAFFHNRLTSVTIENGVVHIGNNAFRGGAITRGDLLGDGTASRYSWNQITSLTIPNSVARIGDRAFQNNIITSLSIPDNVSIGDRAFLYAFDMRRGVMTRIYVNIGANVNRGNTGLPPGGPGAGRYFRMNSGPNRQWQRNTFVARFWSWFS